MVWLEDGVAHRYHVTDLFRWRKVRSLERFRCQNALARRHVRGLQRIEDPDAANDWPDGNSAEVAPRILDTKFPFEPSSTRRQIPTTHASFCGTFLIRVFHGVMQRSI